MLVATVMMVVIVPTAAVWAGGGGFLSRFIADERTHRVVNIALAAMLAATVVLVWI